MKAVVVVLLAVVALIDAAQSNDTRVTRAKGKAKPPSGKKINCFFVGGKTPIPMTDLATTEKWEALKAACTVTEDPDGTEPDDPSQKDLPQCTTIECGASSDGSDGKCMIEYKRAKVEDALTIKMGCASRNAEIAKTYKENDYAVINDNHIIYACWDKDNCNQDVVINKLPASIKDPLGKKKDTAKVIKTTPKGATTTKSGGLGGGAIAGIIIGVLLLVFLLLLVMALMVRKRKKATTDENEEGGVTEAEAPPPPVVDNTGDASQEAIDAATIYAAGGGGEEKEGDDKEEGATNKEESTTDTEKDKGTSAKDTDDEK